jgi:hypothetical protein
MSEIPSEENSEDIEVFLDALQRLGGKDEPSPELVPNVMQEIRRRYPEVPQTQGEGKQTNIPVLLDQLGRVDRGIRHEFDLIGMRMMWFVLSEFFLFFSFTTACNSYAAEHPMKWVLMVVLIAMPVLGIVMAAFVYPAILAAHSAAHLLKHEQERLEESVRRVDEDLVVSLISLRDPENKVGNIPSLYLPPIIGFVWFILLIIVTLRFVISS